MLRIAALLLLASAPVAAAPQAAFHVGARVVSSAKVAAVPAADRDRIQLEVAGHGTQAPVVQVGGGGWVLSSGEVQLSAPADEIVVTFLY
jgi:acetyl esterase/lipase